FCFSFFLYRPMPDIETLMQEWSPEFEELLGKVGLPTAEMNCDLAEYVDMICAILDIPVYKSWIQPLHVLFSLYSEFKNSQVSNPRQAQVTPLEALQRIILKFGLAVLSVFVKS
ncbi:hypothetical protein CIB84_007116, partial [Bambusicola thoracicus]